MGSLQELRLYRATYTFPIHFPGESQCVGNTLSILQLLQEQPNFPAGNLAFHPVWGGPGRLSLVEKLHSVVTWQAHGYAMDAMQNDFV